VTTVGPSVAILRALPGEEVFLAHQASNPVAPPRATEHAGQARATIGPTAATELFPDARA
jgi:hypothetical protein